MGRRAVIASVSVTSKKNTIHAFTEIDISEPRKLLKEYTNTTKEKLSFTAYIVTCLAQAVKENPETNSFIKGNRQIFLDDITISVLVEKEIDGEKIPEPITIRSADTKSIGQISDELKAAKEHRSSKHGDLSGVSWIRFIPKVLLKAFIKAADKNTKMAKRYGKIGVTSIGMYGNDGIWFIPHGSGTVLITVGSINHKVIQQDNKFVTREYLCLTASFDHDIIDGAPAMRFLNRFTEIVKSGELIADVMSDVARHS